MRQTVRQTSSYTQTAAADPAVVIVSPRRLIEQSAFFSGMKVQKGQSPRGTMAGLGASLGHWPLLAVAIDKSFSPQPASIRCGPLPRGQDGDPTGANLGQRLVLPKQSPFEPLRLASPKG
jgi:hypothetical protein